MTTSRTLARSAYNASISRSKRCVASQPGALLSGDTSISAPAFSSTSSYSTAAHFGNRHARPVSSTTGHQQPPTVADARRAFFSLPDISKLAKLAGSAAEAMSSGSGGGAGEVQTDGERQTYHARKILPYSPEQLYNLVADIPSYSSFIPFCTSSTVLQPPSSSSAVASTSSAGRTAADSKWSPPASGKSFEVDAELKVGFGGFDEAYVSRVKGTPYESVSASAGEANLFRSLSTTWAFSPASGLSPHPSTAIPSTTSSSSANTAPRSTQSLETPDSSRGPTLLTIDLAFEFTNPLHRIASQAVLPKVAGKMVDAFEQRCVEVYGKGRD